jgi:hypothetical protein
MVPGIALSGLRRDAVAAATDVRRTSTRSVGLRSTLRAINDVPSAR